MSNLIGIQSKGRQATLKHLVCNDSETSRREYDVQVDERVLREVYLRPFEIAVKESDPSSIMAAYNNVVCIRLWCRIPLAKDRDLGKNQG
jgi:beta-glucosidase-like glycosyl hydrolase